MIKLSTYIFFLLFLHFTSFAQKNEKIVKVFSNEISKIDNSEQIYNKIDSLKKHLSKDIYSFEDDFGISDILDRKIDFNYNHQRIEMYNLVDEFQLDIIKKDQQILLFIIQLNTWENKKRKLITKHYIKNSKLIDTYIKLTNDLYISNKNLENLITEISTNSMYAIRAGYSFSLTKTAKEIQSDIELQKYDNIFSLLKSYNTEQQAFGIYGLSLMKEKNIQISKQILKIEKHIKKRNSETIICAGCLCGEVRKIF